MRPYLSLDIETTGLQDEDFIKDRLEVLEIAYVGETWDKPIAQLPCASFVLDVAPYQYSEPFAMEMHAKNGLLAQINDKNFPKTSVEDAFKKFYEAVLYLSELCYKWDLENTDPAWATRKVCIGGKNAAAFDIPVLLLFFLRRGVDKKALLHLKKHIHHRNMDAGSAYFAHFRGTIPSMPDINKLTGRNQVSHRALDDAFDVVYANRHILGVPFEGKKN
jgi:oligoribonuclease (3'-5' exoribonuclease)